MYYTNTDYSAMFSDKEFASARPNLQNRSVDTLLGKRHSLAFLSFSLTLIVLLCDEKARESVFNGINRIFASLDGQSQIRVAGQNRSEELWKKGGMFGPETKRF